MLRIFKIGIAAVIFLALLFVGGYLLRPQNAPQATLTSDSELFPLAGSRPGEIVLTGPIPDDSEAGSFSISGFRPIAQDVAGASLVASSSQWFLFYSQRETGHIFRMLLGSSLKPDRLTNTTINRTLETLFARDKKGYYAVIRSLRDSTIASVIGSIATSTDEVAELTTKPLNPALADMAISPNHDLLASLIRTEAGSRLEVASLDNQKPKTIFTSPFSDWSLDWPATSTLTLLTKPSVHVPGLLMLVNSKTGAPQVIINNTLGLTTSVSPSGTKVLFSRTTPDSVLLSLGDIAEIDNHQPLSLKTLPEKCVWTASGATIYCAVPNTLPLDEYPDSWYRGDVVFNDSFWAIDTTTLETRKLLNPTALDAHASIDATNLLISPDEHWLYFINKKDQTLWELDITNLE